MNVTFRRLMFCLYSRNAGDHQLEPVEVLERHMMRLIIKRHVSSQVIQSAARGYLFRIGAPSSKRLGDPSIKDGFAHLVSPPGSSRLLLSPPDGEGKVSLEAFSEIGATPAVNEGAGGAELVPVGGGETKNEEVAL